MKWMLLLRLRKQNMNNNSFGFEKPEDSPGFLLWQTTITWGRLIKKKLDPFKISHAQFVILAIALWLSEKEHASTQALIIKMSKLDKMTVSKSLKKLVNLGFVKRNEHVEDSRSKTVILTKKGRELAKKLIPIVELVDEEFFGKLSKLNQSKIIETLRNLKDFYNE